MHEWVLFTCFAIIMTVCGCTQHNYSSEFIIVKGIIIFKHSSDRIPNIMLNQLTRQSTMLQVVRLVLLLRGSLEACKLVSNTAECTYKINEEKRTCHCFKIADMHTYLFDDTLEISDIIFRRYL